MNEIPFIDLKAQYHAYRAEIDEAMAGVVESASFVQGSAVAALEAELAEYVGVRHCVSCGSGTQALYIALRALEIGPGDEVVTTGFSFFATAGAISLVGATPVFVDIESDTRNIDPSQLSDSISERTKAIIAVGLYGQTADMDAICSIAANRGLHVIEDAAQSFGATHHGRRSGSLGTIGCTSFYPAKPLGSFGEGGALFTEDDVLADSMRQIMNQGQRTGYDHVTIGINGRLHALQAAVLSVKLSHFDDELESRARVAQRYNEGLVTACNVSLPVVRADNASVYAQYTVGSIHRDALRKHLAAAGVPTAIHYPKPIYRQDAYAHGNERWVRNTADRCQNCEHAAATVLSLPFGPFLSEGDQERVIDAVTDFSPT